MSNNLMYFKKYLFAQIRRIYFMALPESKEDYKNSRIYYTISDTAVQTIVQLTGGTFLATLMVACGISDATIGIITSLVSLAAISQLFLIRFYKRIKKYKFLVFITATQRMLFVLIYFIPLLSIPNTLKAVLIVIFYALAQIFVQIGTPPSQDWIASLVPSRLRGRYFSIKDSIAVFVVSTTMLLLGVALDYFKSRNILTGFIVIGIVIFILVLINVIALSMMKEPRLSHVNEEGKEIHGRLARRYPKNCIKEDGILVEIKGAFSNRKFRKAFSVQMLYTLAFYIAIPFIASYQINQLALPYTFIMLIGFLANLFRIYISPKLGHLADKYGMAKILRYSLLALGLNLLTIAFTVPANAYPMQIISSLFSSTAWAFVGIGLFGLQLDFYKIEKRMVWLTITSSINGVLGFIFSIIGGVLLDFLKKNPLVIGGTILYPQQVLNFLGFIILLFTFFYIRFSIETEKKERSHNDGRVTL